MVSPKIVGIVPLSHSPSPRLPVGPDDRTDRRGSVSRGYGPEKRVFEKNAEKSASENGLCQAEEYEEAEYVRRRRDEDGGRRGRILVQAVQYERNNGAEEAGDNQV